MEFQITITEEAEGHLDSLSARDRRIVDCGVTSHLKHEPTKLSKSLKKLRPNPFAQYELRLEDYRVLYNVEDERQTVTIVAVGEKRGNKLMVAGEEFHGHESNTAG